MTTDLTTAKVITFNRDTRDFDTTFDGNYIGSFATYHQAENELNQHVLLLCEQGLLDQPLAALTEQALGAALAIPENTDPDDFSDVGPERAPKHTCAYHRDALGRCTMCLTDEADALYHRLLSERDRWPIRSSIRAGFEPLLDKAHRRVIRRIRRQGTAVIAWTDGETPDYKDGCAPVIARAAVIATALVLAALLRS